MSKEKHRKLKIDWLGKCPKCERLTVTVSTIKGSLEKLFDGDKVECWCGQTGEIDTGDNIAWIEWEKVVLSNKDNHDSYYREKYPDYWDRLPGCNNQAWTHYETSLNSWLVALHRAEAKLEGCVVVPVDRINKLVATIEGMFEDDPTLSLGELLPIQQDIKAMVEAARGGNE